MKQNKTACCGIALAAALLLTGCDGLKAADNRCEITQKQVDVGIFGGLGGVGRLDLESRPDGVYRVNLAIFEKLAPEAKPLLVLQGVGRCRGGVLESRFGANAGENAEVKVLGGVIESVFTPSLIDQPFGAWQMDVLQKSDQRSASLSGFWQARASRASGDQATPTKPGA